MPTSYGGTCWKLGSVDYNNAEQRFPELCLRVVDSQIVISSTEPMTDVHAYPEGGSVIEFAPFSKKEGGLYVIGSTNLREAMHGIDHPVDCPTHLAHGGTNHCVKATLVPEVD